MSSYNKTIHAQSVRIGNWQEEAKLQEETGVRYFASPTDRQSSLLTKARCITHSDQVLPRNYTTVTRSEIVAPQSHPEYGNARPRVGPRQQRMDSSLRRSIDEEVERKSKQEYTESRAFAHSTCTHESFAFPGGNGSGFTPTLRVNDVTVRHPTRNANYATDTALTYYSHAVADPSLQVSFPTTFVGSINPFRKNGAFSADIQRHELARRTETYERPTPAPTVLEYKTLTQLRKKLLAQADKVVGSRAEPGERIRHVLNVLLGPDSDFVSLAELQNLLWQELNELQLNESEREALLSAFDMKNNRHISVGDLCLFIKRTPVPRRLELIHFFLSQFETQPNAPIACELLREAQRRNGSPSLSFCVDYLESINPETKTFTAEDFFDYFTDASSEIEDDDAFEKYLKNIFE